MSNKVRELSAKHIQSIIWVLMCLFPIIGMAVDLVSPSLPAIAKSLDIAEATAKNVITIYLLGYAFGNFFTGFLADALGRQKLIRIGLFSFILASALPVVFPSIEVLLLARFLQGLTIGGVAVLSRAIISDILPPEKLVSIGTIMGSVFAIGPIVGRQSQILRQSPQFIANITS